MIKIHTNQQELEYKGIYFPFKVIKKLIESIADPKDLKGYCIHKTFDKVTGNIIRKYAWETIFYDLNNSGALAPILDDIIQREYLD
jgi:hypothetical protein